MAFSKIVLNGTTLIDVTGVTVTENNLVEGITALGADGETVTGVLALPTGTKQISITENGTTTENVAAYANAQITVNVTGGGGDPNENLIKRATNTLTRVDIDLNGTELAGGSFLSCSSLVEAKITNMHGAGSEAFRNCSNLETVVFVVTPGSSYNTGSYCLRECAKLKTVDFSDISQMGGGCFYNDPLFDTLILRKNTITTLSNVNCFYNTKFAQGKDGGTIYIPKVLYDHLGDNSNLDYKAAHNWSTADGYGTITWAKIEGSIYETKYGDGTSIPTT